jgi:hypothetical protein
MTVRPWRLNKGAVVSLPPAVVDRVDQPAVPPTVNPSIRMVGCPTPTGTP